MIITGRDTDILWQPPGMDGWQYLGHGTRCSLSIEAEAEEVARMATSNTGATYWHDRIVTAGTWSGDADLLCTQAEADLLMATMLAQCSPGGSLARFKFKIGGMIITGSAVIDGVDVSGDMDDAAGVSLTLTGCGRLEDITPAGDNGVFDITFDSTFQ